MKVYNDPDHPDYEATRAWAKEQRYREFDKEFINSMLKKVPISLHI
jgi:hypothetical protein